MSIRRRFLGGGVLIALVAAILVGITPPVGAQAADARDFNPGNLISDQQFFNGTAMSAAEVQSLLNSKVASCQSGYTCLKDYRMTTTTRAAVAGRCDAYQGASNETAAQIIAKVGQACGISQKALLVLIEKEQSLVSLRNPSDSRYKIATGYACPDTAACDAQYFGFYNQVYMAALQFKRYQGSPNSWNHVAGRNNSIRLHPNASCGATTVFIQNQATAGLYNYTPYQPNQAALNNLYGTGDSCSSYGNRNFWRIYTDWFGTSTGTSSLMRTADNATVYLVSGSIKYPVTNLALLENLAPLGQVAFVSQSQLNGYTTGQAAGRIMRGDDGSIYYFDSGVRLPFPSCDMVAAYGGSCSATGYVQLTVDQVARFQPGPLMASVTALKSSGTRYFITAGTKREIADADSQAQAGIGTGFNVLSDSSLDTLPLGQPVIADSKIISSPAVSGARYFFGGTVYPVAAKYADYMQGAAKNPVSISASSFQMLASNNTPFNGAVTVPTSGNAFLLSGTGRYQWLADSAQGKLPTVPASSSFVLTYPDQGSIQAGQFIKGQNDDTILFARDGVVRPISSWNAFDSIAPKQEPRYRVIADAAAAAPPRGALLVTPAAMFRTPEDGTMYLIDGSDKRLPLSSFAQINAAGITRWGYIDQKSLNYYTLSPEPVKFGMICGTQKYVAAGGQLVPVTDAALYPVGYTQLQDSTCQLITKGTKPAPKFIQSDGGTLYLLDAGTKRPIYSMARFAELGGNTEGFLPVDNNLSKLIPMGPAA